LLGNSTT